MISLVQLKIVCDFKTKSNEIHHFLPEFHHIAHTADGDDISASGERAFGWLILTGEQNRNCLSVLVGTFYTKCAKKYSSPRSHHTNKHISVAQHASFVKHFIAPNICFWLRLISIHLFQYHISITVFRVFFYLLLSLQYVSPANFFLVYKTMSWCAIT